MFSAAQYPIIFYGAYLLLAVIWLVFLCSYDGFPLLFFGNCLLLILFGAVLAGAIRKYTRQLRTLEKTNEELLIKTSVQQHKIEEAMLAEKVIQEGTNSINQQNSYLISLHTMALTLINRLDLDDLLENIVQNVVRLAGTADALISLSDNANEGLLVKAGTGYFKDSIGRSLLLTDEFWGRVYKSDQSMVLNQIDTTYLSDYFQTEFKAFAVVPLKSENQIIGVIGLGYYSEVLLSQAEIEFFEGFAALASSAVDNARLYEKVQHELSERKLIEENLKYVSIHDPLTGLYNRIYFEEEMRRLRSGRFDPVGIIICDVDGLKLVNDSLGHIPGDELLQAAADVIKNCFRENDVIARIGGDEFAILLPCSSLELVEAAYHRIIAAVAQYNTKSAGFLLSISVGYACENAKETDIQAAFQLADDSMYRTKMKNRKATREALVQSIRELLDSKNFLTGEHSERLYKLVTDLARKIGFSSVGNLTDLSLLTEFHDIGKVGIPDSILTKQEPLTSGEISEIRRHCEMGYRIAKVLPELAPIAECILKHHEWWNGQGYPMGLSGEEIPIECRIWAIADAYNAMISERPYRKALSSHEALDELIKGAGSQFDPALVAVFVKLIAEK